MSTDLTPRQAAERIGSTTRTVQRWIARGEIPATRVGGRWRVASDAIDAFGAAEPAGRPTPAPPPTERINPIRTLFIANRGEIAVRIKRTADRLGIRVIVPGSSGQPAVDLLDIGAVVVAATDCGADAVHPGFGFLSENAAFAEAVEAAGIRWVGPPPSAIRAVGDKSAARRLARRLGVPVVPGYDEDDQSDTTLLAAARRIAGRPGRTARAIMIKPAAGGGGKGMRVVESLEPASKFLDALGAARREASAAFGDDRVVLERHLVSPRHVEVQLLFDAHGNGVHLGERDCSLQRRHQKVLEESPSPAVDEALREQLGAAAMRLAGAVGYRSAGTCEFLLDDDGASHFLEMNTRLQVEHPVTEQVTGRDLVEDQLRIAAGEPLGFDQADADRARRAGGHAIEVRLYAEDPDSGFLPSTGRIEALHWPAGIRIDAGIDPGSTVDTYFDPMLAKLIAAGPSRAEALANLSNALGDTLVLGVVTNLRFLRWLVAQPVVADGEARIDTLAAIWPPAEATVQETRPTEPVWQAAANALLAETDGGWRLNGPASLRIETEGLERTVTISGGLALPRTVVDAAGTAFVDDDGRSVPFRVALPPDVDRAARAAGRQVRGGSHEVRSPMPGSVIAVHVTVGVPVVTGQPLVTLEAMKMEHVVTAIDDGTVAELFVTPGRQVRRGEALVALTAPPGLPDADAVP